MASKKPFKPLILSKTDLLATAHQAAAQAVDLSSITLRQEEDCEFKKSPILPHNPILSKIFALAWLKYFLEGVASSELFLQQQLEQVKKTSVWREIVFKIRVDLLLHASGNMVAGQTKAKVAITQWALEFPNSPYIAGKPFVSPKKCVDLSSINYKVTL
jgi:hypothetical protein